MNIHFASDHAGYDLKEQLKKYVADLGYSVVDHGTHSQESCDYPDFISPCAQAVAADGVTSDGFGIILGGSGQGEAMCANRIKGVRAAVYYGKSGMQLDSAGASLDMITSVREHNNANILSIGARFITDDEARQAVRTFLETPFSGDERHMRRLGKF
jgi:ribose 5-phosphate isomerase B